jgi:hypothetical protein
MDDKLLDNLKNTWKRMLESDLRDDETLPTDPTTEPQNTAAPVEPETPSKPDVSVSPKPAPQPTPDLAASHSGKKLKVLVACEESQTVTKAFRALGHEAFSNDLKPCTGGHPEWHLQGDALKMIDDRDWDLLIAHPPCTFVAGSSVQWLSHPDDKHLPFADRRPHPKYPDRRKDMQWSIEFAIALHDCKIPKVCIENPIGLLSTKWRKPDQIIQPYMFGDAATKTTCLWLKNLPKLVPTNIVDKGERVTFASGKSMPKWYADALNAKTPEERRTLRSKTFPGIANAMAAQWGV